MPDPRMDRVEERIVWLERHVAEQDREMLDLGEELGRLKREMLALRQRADEREATGPGEPSAPADERPPHY